MSILTYETMFVPNIAHHEQSWVNLIGLDPGSETLGVGVLKMDIKTKAILKIRGFTLRGSKLFDDEGFHANLHGARTARIRALKDKLVEIFWQEMPLNIACESPFFSMRRPSAFGALLEVVTAVREAVIEYDEWQKLHLIDPPTVKKAVGAPGNGDKDRVKKAIVENYSQYYEGGVEEIVALDEHSIDADAVVICRHQGILNNIF